MKRTPRFALAIAIYLVLVNLVPCAIAADDNKIDNFDRWFVVQLEGQPAGWMHATVHQDKPGEAVTSGETMKLTIKRGPAVITVETSQSFTETAAGKPLSATTRQKLGQLEIVTTLEFLEDGIAMKSTQGGLAKESRLPLPKEAWLTPVAAARYVRDQMTSGAKEIRYKSLDTTSGSKVVEMIKTFKSKQDIEVFGKTVPAQLWQTQVIGLPIVLQDYTDDEGSPLKSSTQMMGITMTIIAADRAIAEAQINPPELLARTFIKPDKPIDQPRKSRVAVYEVTIEKSDQPAGAATKPAKGEPETFVNTGYQRVVWGDEQTARVVVDLSSPVAAGNDLPKDVNRKASSTLNIDDPVIKDLVAKAIADDGLRAAVAKDFKEKPEELSKPAIAEVLRRFVHRFIEKKSLEVGFATASEVARTAKGDCTEHGVLLAAMLRAAGIPSRTATGIIYVDSFVGEQGIFGYHMWSQAWLEAGPADAPGAPRGGRWVDLDATLDDATPFDAAHITLAVSALDEGALVNDMVAMVGTIGRLNVKVIEVSK